MTLLDRFRAHPRQKHPDPAVRLAFVQEASIDERDMLAEIAREDVDARVRRAAVSKLMAPAALSAIAKNDTDEDVRAHAIAMLRDLALEAFEGVAEADSVAAVDALAALGDLKALAVVAKIAPGVAVADRARLRVTDLHVLASIARHSEHESVRREAFDALRDPRDILSVALNSEFREPTVSAVEQITDREALEQIATRAKNKSAAKRARAITREIDERRALEREALTRASAEATPAARPVPAAAPAAPGPVESARQAQIEADRLAALEREASAREAAAQAAREAEAERARLQAERDRERRESAEKEIERSRVRLVELGDEAARAAAIEDLALARRQIALLRREWNDLSGRVAADPAARTKYHEADAAFNARETAAREADQKIRRTALTKLQQLALRLEPVAARDDLTLKAGDRALRDIRIALGDIPPLPSRQDHDAIVRRLKALQTALTPKVQELREVAGWQRWANVGLQEQLCEKMEALKTLDDPEEIARHVKELQQQWRQAADVPRAQGEILWKRFKAAHDEAWAKCEAHFAAQEGLRAENLVKKTALCDRAEELADSTNWIQTAEEIKKLQAEWKAVGPVSRGQEKVIWERFRAACDRFFTRRHADLAERKKVWAENLAKKDALIAQAEALAESTDWDASATQIRRLQAEWKAIGPVKKSRSEALWQRFRAACDRFFARYAQRHDTARAERVAAREEIVAGLEALAGHEAAPGTLESSNAGQESPAGGAPPADADASPADLLVKMRDLRGRWQQELTARGVDRERASVLDERFAAAFQRVLSRWPSAFAGTDLDPDSNRKRMEALVQRIENLASSLAGQPDAPGADAALSPASRLAAMLKESWAANTIGGKADTEGRFRAAQDEVRQAQSSWSRIGPVPDEARRALADRFQRAIRRITERTTVGRLVGARR
jgi:hypothetical protein